VVLAVPSTAKAQEARGTITGTVADPSKGVPPGATVTVTNIAMSTDVTVQTNDVGYFEAPYLLPGAYRVTVEMQGFKRLVREGIDLRVGDRLQLDLAPVISDQDSPHRLSVSGISELPFGQGRLFGSGAHPSCRR
jgi:hypothetical protein